MFVHFFGKLLILLSFCLRRLDSHLCVLIERFVGAGGAIRKTTVMKRSEEGEANSLSTFGLSHRAHVLDQSIQNARAESKARNANGKDDFDDSQAESRSRKIASAKPAQAFNANNRRTDTAAPKLREGLSLGGVDGKHGAGGGATYKGSLIVMRRESVSTRVSGMNPARLANTRARQDAEQLLCDADEFSTVPRPLEFA